MKQRDSSFLDSIRQEIEEDLTTETEVSNGLYQDALTGHASSEQTKKEMKTQDELPSKPAETREVPDSIDGEMEGQQTEELDADVRANTNTTGNVQHANSPELEHLEAEISNSDLN